MTAGGAGLELGGGLRGRDDPSLFETQFYSRGECENEKKNVIPKYDFEIKKFEHFFLFEVMWAHRRLAIPVGIFQK